ncbi:hypothetical protein HCJ93_03455 [Streptomyces sp. SBST2-5]|uniref:DUF4350 domain-containing protein n=1 Tax=Streptomyces composti TaxID=2720025 RepID=A0ABX1A5M2_9ACTN|nr:hypothetical protein [Streptomyces composti]NJP49154.1 hypothetical protein [Streptomyces composti]
MKCTTVTCTAPAATAPPAGTGSTDGRLSLRPLLVLCFLVTAVPLLILAATAPSSAADEPRPGNETPQAAVGAQAARLAEYLRTSPVHVTDQLPRRVPRSLADDFARLAGRTGVPTYVLVLPGEITRGQDLLDQVHRRLGRDGLYVLIDEYEVTGARAYGVRAPAEAALRVVRNELPFDAGPLRGFERFVEVAAMEPAEAGRLADAAAEAYGEDGPEGLYIGPTDRRDQSFLTGIAVAGVPVVILTLVPYIRRRRRGPPPAGAKPVLWFTPGVPWWRRLLLPAVALLTGAAIAGAAALVFDETRSSAAPTPTPRDMSARVERVVAGLAEDPVYQDPESPRLLDAPRLARLHDRIDRFARSQGGGPVFVTLVPHMPEDETAGDEERFAAAVHARLGEDGVYITADPASGYLNAFNHGLRLNSYDLLLKLPEPVEYGSDAAREAGDHLLGERLDALMTHLDKAPRTDEPTDGVTPPPAPGPAQEHLLPPLFATDFWPGLIMGAVAAVVLVLVICALWALAARTGPRLGRRPGPGSPRAAPRAPSLSWLRRTARTELRAAQAALRTLPATGRDPADPEPQCRKARTYVEAAMSLTDGGDPARLNAPALTPARLLAVTVLARAARAALRGDSGTYCCAVNPLHGPAAGRHRVQPHRGGHGKRVLPLCEPCSEAAYLDPGGLHKRFLTLPGEQRRRRIRYEEASNALLAPLAKDYDSLARKVRGAAAARTGRAAATG